MEQLEKLNKKQIEKIEIYKKKWNDKFFSLEFDDEKARKFIKWIYKLAKEKEPIIIILDSPLSCQIAINVLKNTNLKDKLHSQLRSQLHSQLDSQLHSQLYSQLRSQLRSQLHSQLDSQLDSQLHSQLYSQLRSQLRSQLYSQLRSQLRSQLDSQLYSQLDSQLYSQLDSQLKELKLTNYGIDLDGDTAWYGYYCFYDYVNHVLFPKIKIKTFEEYLNKCENIVSITSFNGICFISRPPTFINFNDRNELHCANDSAIAFKDGWKLHYLYGVYFSQEEFDKYIKDKKATANEIMTIQNLEQKGALIKLYGYEYILSELKDLNKLDEEEVKGIDGNMKKHILYEFSLDNEERSIKCRIMSLDDHSTDRKYFLGVPPTVKTIKEALSWSFQLKDGSYYNPIIQS